MKPGGGGPLEAFARGLGIAVDKAGLERIDAFVELLVQWNARLPLTGDRDRALLLAKHAADSLAICALVRGDEVIVDLGSGAGFPGLVIACVRPATRLTLVDSRRRACSFLEYAAAAVGLGNVRVVQSRVERLGAAAAPGSGADQAAAVVVSRAVAAPVILPVAARVLGPGGVVIGMAAGDADLSEVGAVARRAGLARIEPDFVYELPTGETRRLIKFGPL